MLGKNQPIEALTDKIEKLKASVRAKVEIEAIRQYVEREEARESFKQEALASWAAYKETGRHLTGQEVRTWLNTWGTNDERAVPGCHKRNTD
ncbi:MAG: CopG family transcriptional regulator [Xenophilus sp.]